MDTVDTAVDTMAADGVDTTEDGEDTEDTTTARGRPMPSPPPLPNPMLRLIPPPTTTDSMDIPDTTDTAITAMVAWDTTDAPMPDTVPDTDTDTTASVMLKPNLRLRLK